MKTQKPPVAAGSIAEPAVSTAYPEPYAARVAGRSKRKLGDFFGLWNFGVNLTCLKPGASSSLAHHHSAQDEFVYIVEGEAVLMLDERPYPMQADDCIGLPAGTGIAHRLVNRSEKPVLFIEIGDRSRNDIVEYPFDDLAVRRRDGRWLFTRKDGSPCDNASPQGLD